MALSSVFNVTTDYLLKPSEIDELSVKADILEKQQQQMLLREKQRNKIVRCAIYAFGVYLLFFAVCIIWREISFAFDFWDTPSALLAGFFVATAIVIFICVKILRKND